MKPFLSLLLFSALLPTAGISGTRTCSVSIEENTTRDSVYLLLHQFEEAFVRTQQSVKSNVPEQAGNARNVYDIYRDLSDDKLLLEHGLTRRLRPSRYATSQAQISYYLLPRDSTLHGVERYLLALDSTANPPKPCPEEFRQMENDLQDLPHGLRKRIIPDFRPQMKVPADSVVYITPELEHKLTACLRFAWERDMHAEIIGRVNAYVPVRRGLWGGLRIGKPFVVNYMLFDNRPGRAYVSILTENAEVYGILVVRGGDGVWRIRTAKKLGSFVQ